MELARQPVVIFLKMVKYGGGAAFVCVPADAMFSVAGGRDSLCTEAVV